MKQTYNITSEMAGKRLDVILPQLTGLSRSQIHKRIQEGYVAVNGQIITQSVSVRANETVTLTAPAIIETPMTADIPILYEDADIIALNKPAGLAVHLSESGRPQATVAAWAALHGVIDDDIERPGIVHRLDKDTSGILLIAKHPDAKASLQRQFKERSIKKTYLALVLGRLTNEEATISLPIARDRRRPTKRAVVPGGRPAVTHYRVLEELSGYSLVEIGLETGRTHQVRVHFAHIGHAVAGDSLYGGPVISGLKRQFLHASSMTFTAMDGKTVTVESDLPPDLSELLTRLRAV